MKDDDTRRSITPPQSAQRESPITLAFEVSDETVDRFEDVVRRAGVEKPAGYVKGFLVQLGCHEGWSRSALPALISRGSVP
jgi:hypothetical protein